jgi:hypothetical protein
MPTTRDFKLEEKALVEFRKLSGKANPETLQDKERIIKLAYGANVPEDFLPVMENAATLGTQNITNVQTSLPQNVSTPAISTPPAGAIPKNVNQTPVQIDPNTGRPSIESLRGRVDQASHEVDQYSQPNLAMNVFQEAIKSKGEFNKAGIGQSETFKEAGLTGFENLSQSLSARGKEFENTRVQYQNIVGSMAGVYRDTANNALRKYEGVMEEYNKEVDRLVDIQKRAEDHKRELELIDRRAEVDREASLFRDQLERGNIDPETGDLVDPTIPPIQESIDTLFGDAVITGYGSSGWEHGLDVLLAGGKGAGIVMPVDFELIGFENDPEGFGKQAKVVIEGQELWVSHMDKTLFLQPGQYNAGTKIGTQGNSGNTYSLSGGDGTHVDFTMPDPNSPTGYKSPQEVARFLQAKLKNGSNGELTNAQQLQAKSLSVQLFGTREGTKPENVEAIKAEILAGKSIDDIKDELNRSGQSPLFVGAVRDAAESISIGLTEDKASNLSNKFSS